MARKFLARLLVVILGQLIWAGSAHACISAQVNDGGSIPYSATQTNATVRPLQVRLERNCNNNTTIPVNLYFIDDIEQPPYRVLGGPVLNIRQSGTDYLRSLTQQNFPGFFLNFTGQSTMLEFDTVLFPRTFAESVTRGFTLVLEYTDPDTNAPVEVRQPFTLSITALSSFSIEVLSNGANNATLDFGTFRPGQRLDLAMRAIVTGRFAIDVDSEYGYVLRRVEQCGAPLPTTTRTSEFVDYMARLNGSNVSGGARFTAPAGFGAVGLSNASDSIVTLEVEIDPALDATSKLAGKYCDVLTISIVGMP